MKGKSVSPTSAMPPPVRASIASPSPAELVTLTVKKTKPKKAPGRVAAGKRQICDNHLWDVVEMKVDLKVTGLVFKSR